MSRAVFAPTAPLLLLGAALVAVPLVVAAPLVAVTLPSAAHAQDLPSNVTRRAVRAAVKITSENSEGVTATGSGSIIDPAGYVLTNFHVVGFTTPGHGAPGTLINPNNEVRLSVVTTARETAQARYIGRVVRADARLDLAIVRIIRHVDGSPIPARQRFPSVPLADTSRLRPGSRVFAFGFPLGVRTINVTSGEMSGFQMNSRDEVAWIRTDAEFNPGNSGGMLLDRSGRLVAVPTAVFGGGTFEPIELARPVERIPPEWRTALRRGDIDDVVIGGVPTLALDAEHVDEAVGDGGAFDRPELHYYALPTERPLRLEVSPPLAIGLLSADGRVIREDDHGNIEVRSTDPQDLVLGVLIPARADTGGGTLAIRVRARRGHEGLTGWELPPPGGRTQPTPSRRFPLPRPRRR